MSDRTAHGALGAAEREVQTVYNGHDVPLDRSNLHVGVADWKRLNGICKYNTKPTTRERIWNRRITGLEDSSGDITIAINAEIWRQGDDTEFFDTVRHELAHAWQYARDGHSDGHGQDWKEIARRVGADPSSTHHKKDSAGEYVFGCPECLWWREYHRRSKKIQRPWRWECSDCGTDMSSAYQPSGLSAGECNVDCSDL